MAFKLVTTLLLFLLSSSVVVGSPNYYFSLTGTKEGIIYHNNITSFTNVVPILGFNFSATAPRDIASGLPTGKVQYTPVTIYKDVDVASPLLMQILTTNEVVQATIIAVESAAGRVATTITWKLTNGGFAGVSYEARDKQFVEKVSMTFQRMEIDSQAGGNSFYTTFDWNVFAAA